MTYRSQTVDYSRSPTAKKHIEYRFVFSYSKAQWSMLERRRPDGLWCSVPTFFLYRFTLFIVSPSFISPTDTPTLWRQTRHIMNPFPRWSVLRNEFSTLRVLFCSWLQTLRQMNAMYCLQSDYRNFEATWYAGNKLLVTLVQLIIGCEISGFRLEVDDTCALLGYNAACSGNSLSTFQGNLSVPVHRTGNLATIICRTSRKSRSVNLLQHYGTTCNGIALPYFINGTISSKNLLNICVFWFSLRILSEIFIILRRIRWDIIIIVRQKHLESFEMWCWSRMDSTDFNKTRWNIISFAFNKHIGLKFEEETNKMLYLEHGFVWCWTLDASGSRSETPEKFWNVVLEKDGEDQLDRSCEKWRSVT